MKDGSKFSAKESPLGFTYQEQYALLTLLQANSETQSIDMENIDDVSLHLEDGEVISTIQTKNYDPSSEIGDKSPQLWKSLRIWCENIKSGNINPQIIDILLVTTSSLQANSAISLISVNDRKPLIAAQKLREIAIKASNQQLLSAYEAVLALPQSTFEALLKRVVILSNAPGLESLQDQIKSRLAVSLREKHFPHYLERVRGWWYQQTVDLLANKRGRISRRELLQHLADIRDGFSEESLPIDYAELEPVEDLTEHEFPFVKQLINIGVGTQRIGIAKREFYRAFVQRTRWITDELIYHDELASYERKLESEWELAQARVLDSNNFGDDSTEQECQKCGRDILSWAEQVDIPIRPAVTEPFVKRGSFHMLANELPPSIWWHPRFSTL